MGNAIDEVFQRVTITQSFGATLERMGWALPSEEAAA